MSIGKGFLPEFDQEMANTRKTLERIPDDKLGWKPHEKSTSMGALAGHLAEIPGWVVGTLHADNWDIAPPGGPAYTPPAWKNRDEILAAFDKEVKSARKALDETSDETILGNWSLLAGGQTLFTMPRVGVIRTWVLNHSVHHRAQLGVYLRLNDLPVPAIYGPSADEGNM